MVMACEQRAFDQDAQVGAGKGRIGVVNDDDLAVWVQQEQSRLWEWLVCFADVAWLWTWKAAVNMIQRGWTVTKEPASLSLSYRNGWCLLLMLHSIACPA